MNCAEYVPARRGSYGSQDPDRKGGSDEWLAARKLSWWVVEYGGLYFFWRESHLYVCYILLLGGIYVEKVRSAGHIFKKFFPWEVFLN